MTNDLSITMLDSSTAPVLESKYKISGITNNSFTINCPDKPSVIVSLTCENRMVSVRNADSDYGLRFGLFQFFKIIDAIAEKLNRDWKPSKAFVFKGEAVDWIPKKLTKWVCRKTGTAISKRVRDAWRALLSNADKASLDIQRAYFAANCNFNQICVSDGVLKQKYICKDILNYRAAALALSKACANSCGFLGWCDWDGGICDSWMTAYAGKDKQPNGPLRKTLMHLPPAIPVETLMHYFSAYDLERPIFDRLELMGLVAGVHFLRCRNDDVVNSRLHLLNHTTHKQWLRAAELVGKHLRKKKIKIRKYNEVSQLANFILDYPDTHNGNIVGLAEKSIAWHRNHGYDEVRKRYSEYTEDTPTTLPKIDLPKSANIKFLHNVKSICDEGANMSHCVAGYAGGAVKGQSYLFHISYKDTEATVEVGQDGRVCQSRGPHNVENAASKWGARVLAQWGRELHDKEDVIECLPF